MACRIINSNTGDIVDKKSISDNDKWYEFDSAEEALLELIVGKMSLRFCDKTLFGIKNIVHPLVVRGVNLPQLFFWRKYIFQELGRIVAFVGEMQEKKELVSNKMLDLSNIDWNAYSEAERGKIFTDIGISLGLNGTDDTNEIIIGETIQPVIPNIPKESFAVPDKHVVYLLYCENTPNIYYIGKSKNVQQRIKAHIGGKDGTEIKNTWINHIKSNGYELKYSILDTGDALTIDKLENDWILKYISNKENVVLNFTTKHYSSDNQVFNERFNACLYEKRILIVDDYNNKSLKRINNKKLGAICPNS